MATDIFGTITGIRGGTLTRGLVAATLRDGDLLVVPDGDDEPELRCSLLVTSPEGPIRLERGDRVLVWRPDEQSTGVVFGRLGSLIQTPPRQSEVAQPRAIPAPVPAEPPAELVLEATHSLTLRVGDGSITIRDGRVLIKGKDLVSHAQRTNRIKGGSVSIN